MNPELQNQKNTATVLTRWYPPPMGWIKVNSDGPLSADHAGYGLLLRNSEGNFIVGEMARSQDASVNHLKLLSLKRGIQIFLENGFSTFQFETDSQTVINWIHGKGCIPWRSKRLLIQIMELLHELTEWTVIHTHLHSNHPADLVASRKITIGSVIIQPDNVCSPFYWTNGGLYERQARDQLKTTQCLCLLKHLHQFFCLLIFQYNLM